RACGADDRRTGLIDNACAHLPDVLVCGRNVSRVDSLPTSLERSEHLLDRPAGGADQIVPLARAQSAILVPRQINEPLSIVIWDLCRARAEVQRTGKHSLN